MGLWHEIKVDDYIPCYPNGNPIFSNCCDSEESIWLLILEKAFAKMYGCYKLLEGGSPIDGVRDILGYPCSIFNFTEETV